MRSSLSFSFLILSFFLATSAFAGPFNEAGIAKDDPTIIGWAVAWSDYLPADYVDDQWKTPDKALGAAVGSVVDVVSLGECLAEEDLAPGTITLTFAGPLSNREGCDLAVFENGFPAGGGLSAELAYVEVSTDGETWARFPSVSLTPAAVGDYGVIDPTDVYNLAGKHAIGAGTPFDLADLLDSEAVVDGLIDLEEINFIRIVDVPGSGEYFDEATSFGYEQNNPIFDFYPTYSSGGFDLEAIGIIDENAANSLDDDVADDDSNDDDEADDDQNNTDQSNDDDDSNSGCA